eukprot:8954053-Lingulodinium_polyedra.AAC.1
MLRRGGLPRAARPPPGPARARFARSQRRGAVPSRSPPRRPPRSSCTAARTRAPGARRGNPAGARRAWRFPGPT